MPQLPEKLDNNYEVIRKIGNGTYAVVVLARHKKFINEEVAIKIIDKTNEDFKKNPKLLENEVR